MSGPVLTEADNTTHPLPPSNLTSDPPPHGYPHPPLFTPSPLTQPSKQHNAAATTLWKPKPERRKRRAPDSGNRSTLKLQTLSLRSKGYRSRASWDPRREERELRQGEEEDRQDRHSETQTDIQKYWQLSREVFIKFSNKVYSNFLFCSSLLHEKPYSGTLWFITRAPHAKCVCPVARLIYYWNLSLKYKIDWHLNNQVISLKKVF